MIGGAITLEDYLAAQRLHQRRALRRLLLAMTTLLLLGLAVFAFAAHEASPVPSSAPAGHLPPKTGPWSRWEKEQA